MIRALAVLRPEPGNAATARRIEELGLTAIRLPLFAVVPLAWTAPDPATHDAVLFTSANAPRHGGAGLAGLTGLPAYAIGAATADAARAAGFDVAAVGTGDWRALYALARSGGVRRGLLLTGRERAAERAPPVTAIAPVYASKTVAMGEAELARLRDTVVLLHSARAASRLAALVTERGGIRIAALSSAVRAAAGTGWAARVVAEAPDDPSLIAAARRLAAHHAD